MENCKRFGSGMRVGEERVIHRLGELEHRDTKLLRTLTCEGRQGSL